jgi:hypothetical protein
MSALKGAGILFIKTSTFTRTGLIVLAITLGAFNGGL